MHDEDGNVKPEVAAAYQRGHKEGMLRARVDILEALGLFDILNDLESSLRDEISEVSNGGE